MKKMLSVILIFILACTTVMTAAIAATKEELSSRTVSNQAIGYDAKNKGYFEYLILESDLSRVEYKEVTPKITNWDGIFIVSNSSAVIGRLWPKYDTGKAVSGKGIVNFEVAFNKKGELWRSKTVTCYTKEQIDFSMSMRHLRFVDVKMQDGTWQTHLVVVTESKSLPTKAPVKPTATKAPVKPTATKTPVKPTATKAPSKPTPTPKRNTPNPQLTATPKRNTPNPQLTPRVTPKPVVRPTATKKPVVTPAPQKTDRPKVTPKPVITDPNPTLKPSDDELLDFTDIPVKTTPKPATTPKPRATPKPVITDPNPTLKPSDDNLLDFN